MLLHILVSIIEVFGVENIQHHQTQSNGFNSCKGFLT